MDRAHEHGINFFDTANVYGWKTGEGVTEQIIGRWFAQGGGRRERTVLATKLYGDMGDWPNDGKLSALNIRRACDASLRRLQTDYIDLYQMHHVDRATPWDEIWEAMEVLRAPGQDPLRRLVELRRLAHRPGAGGGQAPRHFLGLVSEQSIYNLIDRTRRARGAARGAGLRPRRHPVVAAARRAARRRPPQGARTQPAQLGAAPRTRWRRTGTSSRRTRTCAPSSARSPAHVGLAWLLSPAGGDRARSSARARRSSSTASLRAVEITLDDKALARLDEIFPGHRTAPEDYAW